MHKHLLIILILSIAVHFAFFGRPAETVFDEVHFGKFVSGYYTGEYYFDIHPPLGKLIIAGFAKIFDFKPEYNFTEIGKEFPDKKYLALRFLPAMAGALLPVVIYLLILELGLSRTAAFAGGLLLVFENSLLTQSRLMLLDPFLLLFGFLTLLFYFKSHHSPFAIRYWLLTAVFGGLAVSIKFTGLSFIALPILIETIKNFKILKRSETGIKLAIANFMPVFRFLSFFIISAVIYFSIFVLHFALLPKSGPGDAFMSPSFRKTLIGNSYQNTPNIKPANILSKFMELNREMYKSNQRLTATHPYSSQWYSWPFMARPIFYWVKNNARIYFLGNPIIWWTSTVSILYSVFSILYSKLFKNNTKYKIQNTIYILLGGYFLNLLPFIGIKRAMFLYHYLTALIFAVIMLCYLIDGFDKLTASKNKNSRKIFTGIVIASIAAFLFFSPLNYGLSLSDKAYEARVWFASWR